MTSNIVVIINWSFYKLFDYLLIRLFKYFVDQFLWLIFQFTSTIDFFDQPDWLIFWLDYVIDLLISLLE